MVDVADVSTVSELCKAGTVLTLTRAILILSFALQTGFGSSVFCSVEVHEMSVFVEYVWSHSLNISSGFIKICQAFGHSFHVRPYLHVNSENSGDTVCHLCISEKYQRLCADTDLSYVLLL